jgi:HAD superfamily hydrolase (TIGR01509 family)
MGGVLYDDTTWRRWLLRLLGQLGLHTHYRAFFRVWDREYLVRVERGEAEFCDMFRSFMLAVGLRPSQIDEVQAACQARRREMEAAIRVLPGVKTTLSRLRQTGMVLGALTNSEHSTAVLCERLDRIGLSNLFSVVISSFDLKRTKPDAASYQAALGGLGLKAADTAFVGHDTEELAGASAVGMRVVAVNFDPDAQADVFIARIEQLTEVLDYRRPLAAAG